MDRTVSIIDPGCALGAWTSADCTMYGGRTDIARTVEPVTTETITEPGEPLHPAITPPSPLTHTVDLFGRAIPVWLLLVGAGIAVAAISSKK